MRWFLPHLFYTEYTEVSLTGEKRDRSPKLRRQAELFQVLSKCNSALQQNLTPILLLCQPSVAPPRLKEDYFH